MSTTKTTHRQFTLETFADGVTLVFAPNHERFGGDPLECSSIEEAKRAVDAMIRDNRHVADPYDD